MDYKVIYEEYINGAFIEKEDICYIDNFESDEALLTQVHNILVKKTGSNKIIVIDVVSVVDSEIDPDSFEG